ncbi:hypothetical protein HNY73_008713 [Argiope bruennichi]|uniref:Uncharacterized protein n=1 Tax=Argiope bruennichi TaxID=94029 RepID=A0A8T0FDT4_ARGBR|nr:hypothetical protein HNY73_008713 [Argiope bruennichi]
MEDYLFAMFLAEDVMKYVLQKHGIEWEVKHNIRSIYKGKYPEKTVILPLKKAVIMFIDKKKKHIKDILRDYTKNNSSTVREFCHYAIEFGSEVFKDGFDPVNFIKYCAIVAEMAYRLYDHCQDIPEQAVGVIGTVLVSQMMTQQFEESGNQEGLKKASLKLLKQLKDVKSTVEYATTSV